MAKKKAETKTRARPKAGPAGDDSARQKNVLVLRGTEEWKAWLDGLASAISAPLTGTIDRALNELAASVKYRKPPRRTP